MDKPKVINLFGGPCAGKSTVMAGLFWLMRCQGYNVEMCPEQIKNAVFEKHPYAFVYQELIFAEQLKKMLALKDYGVPYIVTDSPLLLTKVYGKNLSSGFQQFVDEELAGFTNYNIFLSRCFGYNRSGRVHSLEDAKKLDSLCLSQIFERERTCGEYSILLRGDMKAPMKILKTLTAKLPEII